MLICSTRITRAGCGFSRPAPFSWLETGAAVRLLPEWREPHILICSADADTSGVRYAAAFRQADAIAAKPINPRELVAEALQLIARQRVRERER